MIGAAAGAVAIATAMSQLRALDGRMRIDLGSISLINNPATQERILLNHLMMEARILLPSLAMPGIPGAPRIPAIPLAAAAGLALLAGGGAATLIQLGKSLIQGLEVQGTRYIFPVIPGAPLPSITSWEMWLSTKLKVPVLTTTLGAFGQMTTRCNVTGIAPPPTSFQIPPTYRVVTPPPPGVPPLPNAPITAPSIRPPTVPPVNIPGR
jgi:hypothetical protein